MNNQLSTVEPQKKRGLGKIKYIFSRYVVSPSPVLLPPANYLLLSRYGFRMKNITAIDLFSFSPFIDVMDMHNLQYPDNSFDIVYSSFVITYSDRIPLACAEALRVAKDGALMVFAFEHMHEGLGNKFGVNRLSGGVNDLYPYFNNCVDAVLWREEHDLD